MIKGSVSLPDITLARDGQTIGRRLSPAIVSIKRTYRKWVPAAIRQSSFVQRILGHVHRCLPHDAVYDEDYYWLRVHKPAAESARVMSQCILADIEPQIRTVIDVGCGTGALLEELRAQGCEVCGLDYSDAALAHCRTRHLKVLKCDLERDEVLVAGRFDLAVSMEVAEHLPRRTAGRLVDLLCDLAHTIVFTAAAHGQGGTGHVNEQPASYWIDMFQRRGFAVQAEVVASWRARWRLSGTVQRFYYENLMVFRRSLPE